jgi:hypothetical protein
MKMTETKTETFTNVDERWFVATFTFAICFVWATGWLLMYMSRCVPVDNLGSNFSSTRGIDIPWWPMFIPVAFAAALLIAKRVLKVLVGYLTDDSHVWHQSITNTP